MIEFDAIDEPEEKLPIHKHKPLRERIGEKWVIDDSIKEGRDLIIKMKKEKRIK